ncbi:MAG: carbon starvation protein A [Cetobacterium sp.]|nr:carbon starvation protein A [Cetobacterium sp.]
MYSFLLSMVALLVGYFVYGKIVDRIFGSKEDAVTPAKRLSDGVDYIELDWKKAFLIQFLNIAGTGPIFGAVAGAMWGPVAFLWIVFGCIFAGAVHDFLIGMMSLRDDGATIAEIVGKYLGNNARTFMRFFSVILLLLVGVVFIMSPADILNSMTGVNKFILIGIIIIYYLLATILPVDKVIGKIYPIFGACLLIMAAGIAIGITVGDYHIPEVAFVNMHPDKTPIFPYLFISIACGAISGFHATQSPMMARCLKNEKEGRRVFYGSMIAEGFVALIWAAAAMSFFGGTEGLKAAGTPGVVVSVISNTLLGKFGGVLAILGVVACPITSGDTAFRSARMAIADACKFEQKPIKNRFIIAIPLFAVGIALCFIDFTIIWRYFAWSNQTMATFALWAAAKYLAKEGKNFWIAAIPGTFMTVVVTSYIIIAKEGLNLGMNIGVPVGLIVAAICFFTFLKSIKKHQIATA